MGRSSFGFDFDLMPDDLISNSIRRKGIYDVVTAEVIYRLLDDAAQALDIGAHVGIMSVVMGLRVGRGGEVRSLEPHPELFSKLQSNALRLNSMLGSTVILPLAAAASDHAGPQQLALPRDWSKNTGGGRIPASPQTGEGGSTIAVECVTLDGAFPGSFSPTLVKLDVEGHEIAVLRGAANLLSRSIRDVVFEDFGSYPSPVMALLEAAGFLVFALWRSALRPKLAPPGRRGVPPRADPNYLATRDPDRVRRRLAPAGWNVLERLARSTGST